MSAIADELDVVVGKLAAAGLDATRDPGALPPFVLVDVPELTTFTLGSWSGSVAVKVISPPPGDLAAATWLLETVEAVLVALGPPRSALPATVVTGAGKECPAYVVTYPLDVPSPYC